MSFKFFEQEFWRYQRGMIGDSLVALKLRTIIIARSWLYKKSLSADKLDKKKLENLEFKLLKAKTNLQSFTKYWN